MPDTKKFSDDAWTADEWRALLEHLIGEGLLSWKEVTALTLGHMNPSQVGTSLASSDGFKRRYGKGNVMAKVMGWFYQQDGKCHDCGTRLELQADHNKPREEYADPLDADFIENMVLRCRRCNVIRRPSHEYGGQTHLTAETALMWILFSFRPRTLTDFVRMCRLYGMTMADVRMQEGWAMAHWLQKGQGTSFILDSADRECQILAWPDGGLTRCWTDDDVPGKQSATILFNAAYPTQHLLAIAHSPHHGTPLTRVQAIRMRVGSIPFSHYFEGENGESLAISYTAPKRKQINATAGQPPLPATGDVVEDTIAAESAPDNGVAVDAIQIKELPEGAKLNLLAPRGMTLITAALVNHDSDATISWTQRLKQKSAVIAATGRGRKLGDIDVTDIAKSQFKVV